MAVVFGEFDVTPGNLAGLHEKSAPEQPRQSDT
jgi:hypothetical protein